MQHNTTAARKITISGQRVCPVNVLSSINRYPHAAGNSFPAISNGLGSMSTGNIIPDSIMDGRKSRIENMDVFAVSFTAKPIMLAILRDTAIRIINPPQYVSGCSGIFTSKAIGAITVSASDKMKENAEEKM